MSKIPEAIEWGLNPLFWTPLKLFNAQITRDRLEGTEPTFPMITQHPKSNHGHVYNNQFPVTRVSVMGIVVQKQLQQGRIRYVLDDGSSLLHCTYWLQDTKGRQRSYLPIELGDCVRCIGRLTLPPKRSADDDRSSTREVSIQKLEKVDNMALETLHWLEVIQLNKQQYVNQTKQDSHWMQFQKEFGNHLGENVDRTIPDVKRRHVDVVSSQELFAQDLYNKILISNTMRPKLAEELTREDVAPAALCKALFTSSDIENVPCLKDVLRSAGCDLKNVQNSITTALEHLRGKGFVYCWNAERNIFGVVTHELTLVPAILTTLAQKLSVEEGTVGVTNLVELVQQDSRCALVPKERILRSIQLLQETGVLNWDELKNVISFHM